MVVKAYSYLRFSTPEQAKGDSQRRQTELAERYAAANGLELDKELTFRDLGVSAFHGANAETGALRVFRNAVEEGAIPPGSYLLVESLDRLSRQAAWDAFPIFQGIVNAGVTIVTLADGRAYTREELRANPMRLFEPLLVMMRANEESATKSRRLQEAWSNKRTKAADKPLTGICPAWLQLDRATGRFSFVEGRVEVVRRIFDLAMQGVGLHGIARALNEADTETFGGHSGRRAEAWGRSYVAKIVANPATYGVLVPHVVEHAEGTKQRRALDPIPGYFPAAISEETFRAVQATRVGTAHTARHRGAGQGAVTSMVAGLAECCVCGATMTRVVKGPRGGKPRLVCVRAKTKRCAAPSAVLPDVEAALLSRLDVIEGSAPLGGEELQQQVERLDVLADLARELLAEAEADWRASRSPAARDRMARLGAELDIAMRELAEAQERRAAAGPGLARRLAEYRAAVEAVPVEPAKVNFVLRQMFSAIVVNPTAGRLTLVWHGGAETDLPYAWGRVA